jgi:hypothetical protein
MFRVPRLETGERPRLGRAQGGVADFQRLRSSKGRAGSAAAAAIPSSSCRARLRLEVQSIRWLRTRAELFVPNPPPLKQVTSRRSGVSGTPATNATWNLLLNGQHLEMIFLAGFRDIINTA